ncbi:MAG TPA: DUF6089 family protein, partial [Paludibacter sp.]|nr:DUF6089 family protein [Paludibacter sp.]
MKIKLIRLFTLFVWATISANTFAQDNYRAEIGVAGGGSYYLGDANSQLFTNMHSAYGAFLRYRFDPRFAVKAEFTRITKLVGANDSFVNDNGINVGDLCLEFNFFDLENNPFNRHSRIFSPFIFSGAGMMTDLYINQKHPEPFIPFGVGMKVKLAERWNFIAQWSNRLLLFSDNMENNPKYDNPKGLNGSNIFNNDLLSTITVGISFDFWEKRCNCLKQY